MDSSSILVMWEVRHRVWQGCSNAEEKGTKWGEEEIRYIYVPYGTPVPLLCTPSMLINMVPRFLFSYEWMKAYRYVGIWMIHKRETCRNIPIPILWSNCQLSFTKRKCLKMSHCFAIGVREKWICLLCEGLLLILLAGACLMAWVQRYWGSERFKGSNHWPWEWSIQRQRSQTGSKRFNGSDRRRGSKKFKGSNRGPWEWAI